MSDDEQGRGGRVLRVGKKRDGPNWFMLAGGAVAMAVSVVFGCRKVLGDGTKVTKEKPESAASARTSAATAAREHLEDAEAGSVHTYETQSDFLNTTPPYWENEADSAAGTSPSPSPSPSLSGSTRILLNCKTKRPAAADPSPQAPSKFCRQLSQNSVCQSNHVPGVPSVVVDGHSTTVESPAALQGGLTARNETVHRLRQQIRSRDAMIYDMQMQLSDQDQMIAMHRNRSVDLQECVQDLSTQLYEANLEVQRLHRELLAQRAKPAAELDEECIDIAVAEIKRQWVHPDDVEGLILEARKLNEEVERLERENEAKASIAQAKSRQCELLCKKVSTLATELEEVKTAAHGKQRLLEAKEHENSKLTDVLHDLRHKFEKEPAPQERGSESTRNNNSNSKLTGSMQRKLEINHDHAGRHASAPIDHEEASATRKGVFVDGHNRQNLGNLRKSQGSVHARNDDTTLLQQQAGSEDSVAKADSRCVSDAHTKRRRSPAADQDDYTANVHDTLDEREILKFSHDVDQIASAISVTSELVSEQMQAASRVLMDLQEHLIGSRTGAQIGPRASWKCPEFLQVFSCLSEGMSPNQKQAMRSEFELKVAKQQDIEGEMKMLSRHQTKLRELKYALAKVIARLNARGSDARTSGPDMASSLSDIEQKLAVQEEITEEASLFIEQLSKLFPRSSPQTPPVQEAWKTVKEKSGNSTAGSEQRKHLVRSSDEKSRSTLRKLDRQNSSHILERQDSSSGSRHWSPNSSPNGIIPTDRLIVTSSSPLKQLLDTPYRFQLGSSSSPASRPRTSRNTLSAAGRICARKSVTTDPETYAAGSKRHAHDCVGAGAGVGVGAHNSSPSNRAAIFSSEATGGFSFGFSARDRPLDKMTTTKSRTLESEPLEAIVESSTAPAFDHGNRMSSPEPEPSAHLFTEQRFLAFTKGLESKASFSKRFRSAASPDFSPVQSPGYDNGGYYSRFGSPQSPSCGELTVREDDSASSLRRSLFTRASNSSPLAPTATASTSRVDRDFDRDFQIKRPTEETVNSTQGSYNSNRDCSPRPISSTRDSVAATLWYVDARRPGSPVDSLRNFDMHSNQRDQDEHEHDDEDDEDEGGLLRQSVRPRATKMGDDRQLNSYNRELDSLCRSVSNLSLDTKESSGSGNQVVDQPVKYSLRRSNSSNRH